MSETNTATASGLTEFRTLVDTLQQRKVAAQNEVATIDREMLAIKNRLDGVLSGVATPSPVTPRSPTGARRGRPPGSKNRATRTPRGRQATAAASTVEPKVKATANDRSRGRNGGQSGTQKIEAILAAASNKSLPSGDLAREAAKQGVPHPHSSFQSLKRRGRIEMKDGVVSLVG